MKLSDKQAILLFQIAMDTRGIVGDMMSLSQQQRLDLVNKIINQQDESIKDLTKDNDLV